MDAKTPASSIQPVPPRTVELHSAFVWDCDECGSENFERVIEREVSMDELDEDDLDECNCEACQCGSCLDEDDGEDGEDSDGEDGDGYRGSGVTVVQVLAPTVVKCRKCGYEFASTFNLDDDEDEDDDLNDDPDDD